MKSYSISKLAAAFGLSRSTLLYYDKIGLLPPSGRSAAGYRAYTDKDRRRLEKISRYRATGLSIEAIRRLLEMPGGGFASVLKRRLHEISGQIVALKKQQNLLSAMLKQAGSGTPLVDEAQWVRMFRKAGLDEKGMAAWHAEFEHHCPEAHHDFLKSLGIRDAEIESIRQWAKKQPARS